MSEGCWYVERWYKGDLEVALEASDIPITEENLERLKESCKGIFDDKTERNEILAEKARVLFSGDLDGKGRLNMEVKTVFELKKNVEVTNQDIDDIMVSALEGGINYWCIKAEVIGKYLGEYGSDQISRGGTLKLYDCEEDAVYELTREKFLKGLELYLEKSAYPDFLQHKSGKLVLDTCYADAEVADSIVQYAVFGDIIYG